jgi:PIN domain nuclease of toxin-antitoxin system
VIVLDTHIWYWWINVAEMRLSSAQAREIESAPRIGVAAVSCYEIAHAVRRGRIVLPMPVEEWFDKGLAGSNIEVLALTPGIALSASVLQDHHRDPFDRMIIATALEWDGQLAFADGQFAGYPELASRLLA